jgi:hypothetical protein
VIYDEDIMDERDVAIEEHMNALSLAELYGYERGQAGQCEGRGHVRAETVERRPCK